MPQCEENKLMNEKAEMCLFHKGRCRNVHNCVCTRVDDIGYHLLLVCMSHENSK